MYYATKAEAYKLYDEIIKELKEYPWSKAGLDSWVTVVRLVELKAFLSNDRYLVCVGYKGYPESFPDYIPNPIAINKLRGGWAAYRNEHEWNNPAMEPSYHDYSVLMKWVPN